MKHVILLIVPLAIQFAVHFATANQTNFLLQPRIFGGSAITIRDVPFLLSFHWRGKFHCGGVIISRSWALTALHCIGTSQREEDYFVRAGSTRYDRGGSTHSIKKFYSYNSISPNDPMRPRHDILLFSVKNSFRFSDNVKPAKLPLEGTESPDSLQVSGWGMTSTFSSESDVILTVNVTKLTIEECLAAAPSVLVGKVTEKLHLCSDGRDADGCQGDSGGPVADSQTVYGLVLGGPGCGISPEYYTKVSFYRQWIKQIAGI